MRRYCNGCRHVLVKMGVKHVVLVCLLVICLVVVPSALHGKSVVNAEAMVMADEAGPGGQVATDSQAMLYQPVLSGIWPKDMVRDIFSWPVSSGVSKPDVIAEPDSQASARKPPGIRLAGIIEGEQMRAIINDQLLGIGDVIHGYRLVEISGRRVLLEAGGIRYEIAM